MMKKLIALMLTLVLCLTMFAGCSGTNAEETEEDPAVIDYSAAFAKHDPNTVVMTINGTEVSWSEFFYMLYSSLSQIQYYLGDIYWGQNCASGIDMTFEEYTMDMTMTMLKQLHAVEKKAKELNISLTKEDQKMIEETIETLKQQNCGEDATDEAFYQFLLENVYLTEEAYHYVNENSLMYEKVFVETVGPEGEKISDAEIQDFIESVPYITAKHILLMTVDPQTGEALPEEKVKQAKETAQELLEQLKEIPDRDTLVSTFDSLMQEYNEDSGVQLFPYGYTFTNGQMYEVFEEAAFALDDYEISELVESEAGYHILMRIPTNRDSLVDFDYENNVYYTVETYAMTDIYSKLISSWMGECEIIWSKDFEGITAEEIFS